MLCCVVLCQEEREEHLRVQRQADAYSPDELGEVLDKYGAKSPSKNPLTEPFPFNLMFKVSCLGDLFPRFISVYESVDSRFDS